MMDNLFTFAVNFKEEILSKSELKHLTGVLLQEVPPPEVADHKVTDVH